MTFDKAEAKSAVVTVGEGRGFVVEGTSGRVVITAAHCLPHFPPAASISYTHERTYTSLLARLGDEGSVTAECLFADPVADIAVLGAPDNQARADEADAYEELIGGARVPLRIADTPADGAHAWLLSLEGHWFSCDVQWVSGQRSPLWLFNAKAGIAGGMSGSPILSGDGAAIGVVVAAGGTSGSDAPTEGGPSPRLVDNLPPWLLRECGILPARPLGVV